MLTERCPAFAALLALLPGRIVLSEAAVLTRGQRQINGHRLLCLQSATIAADAKSSGVSPGVEAVDAANGARGPGSRKREHEGGSQGMTRTPSRRLVEGSGGRRRRSEDEGGSRGRTGTSRRRLTGKSDQVSGGKNGL